ncbi:hypothetical protein FQN55_001834 [Onygenales sp. PD_40]|nr:hypothetical protein FQN55_001834 [Onygenales sp. PD_40]KAK2790542.1 hypothetical protein FQN52_005561 [Onygenales sp. PD_12]
MIHTARSRYGTTRKVSPPGPSYMNDEQVATYLKDLRTNRPPRPNGSRPLPTKEPAPNPRFTSPPRASSALSMNRDSASQRVTSEESYQRSASALSHCRTDSGLSTGSESTAQSGVQEIAPYDISRSFSPTPSVMSNAGGTYRERGQRWMEREEARSLREALEEMDFLDEEKRLHTAAQDEATQLVLSHQTSGFPKLNPHAPYRNPDINLTNRFRQHLEKGAHERSQSLGGIGQNNTPVSGYGTYRSSSGSSNASRTGRESPEFQRRTVPGRGRVPSTIVDTPEDSATVSVKKKGTLRKNTRVNFALPPEDSDTPPTTVLRRNTSPRTRIVSNESVRGIFRNPEDQIYEEPQDDSSQNETQSIQPDSSSALKVKPRNSLPRGARPLPDRSSTVPESKRVSIFDIHKNPPTQSRNPLYKANSSQSPPTTSGKKDDDNPPSKNGLEIRGDDIRAATSMRLKDRSAKLPMPTVVSDRPGRPIVSFDKAWKSPEQSQSNSPGDSPANSRGGTPQRTGAETTPPPSTNTAPTINVTESPTVPVINVSGEDSDTPVISVSSSTPPTISAMAPPNKKPSRPLPQAGSQSKRNPFRRSTGSSSNGWYSPYTRTGVPTASCTACGLPIAGRIVTACESRFHPECFACHHCQTALECVAFYQEPEAKRNERLENADPNDEEANAKRFYCHLDFHELFSPRCKSCKTPIEGEVIIACGAEWHVGHFFCAECGDPFTPTTPFVEKSGFAWCVSCHSKRSASRCQGCKQPVLEDVVVTALGGQWHQNCFVCSECSGSFGPEGRFFVKEGQPRFTSKGRQIGGPVEVAVCEACEGRRLKSY